MNYAWMSLKRFDKKGDSANKRKVPQLLEKKKYICRQERKAKDELKGNGQVKFLNDYKETMMQYEVRLHAYVDWINKTCVHE